MKIKVINLYNNKAKPNTNYKAAFGNAFYFDFPDQKILFDLGWKGNVLLHNLSVYGISPDSIDTVIFSHGHMDHTKGLKKFIESVNKTDKIKIIAHPDANEPKRVKILGLRLLKANIPQLPESSEEKIEFNYLSEWSEITPNLFYTGEITERKEIESKENKLIQKINGKWVVDPLRDDISLVLKTKNGLVVFCGCCHAGLLNVLAHIKKHLAEVEITSIVGGTHMAKLTEIELEHVANMLKKNYGAPDLYLNHCTGKKAIKYFKEYFGEKKVHLCLVGKEFEFDLA